MWPAAAPATGCHAAKAAGDKVWEDAKMHGATKTALCVVPVAWWLLLLASGCAVLAAVTPPAPYSESARRLAPGPYQVESAKVVFEDAVRGRTLVSTLWWPVSAAGPVPLVVQTHGFLGNRSGGVYIAEPLASRGYVVVAPTHPNTTLFAPGGAKIADVVQQPGDVSFLIDRLLADDGDLPRHPPIDPTRIAVIGHSLGGLTATLTAFHRRLRDPRIAAAISIAGPMEMFEQTFFATAPVPFMMIAGSDDVIVDYRRNAFVTLDRVPGGTLVLLAGASHTGFDDATSGLPRLLDNPDTMGCWVLHRTLHLDAAQARLQELAQDGDGVTKGYRLPTPCTEDPPPVAMDPARQHLITSLAVTAFLESHFAPERAERSRALNYLTSTLSRDFDEVAVETAAGGGR